MTAADPRPPQRLASDGRQQGIAVLHVAASDVDGGAARAAYRIHRALVDADVDGRVRSTMRVCHKLTSDETVVGGACTRGRLWRGIRGRLAPLPHRRFRTASLAYHTAAWPATGLGRALNAATVDLLHLHWLGRDTLSIEEIGALRRPLVWTLHDMWPFCGAEVYTDDERYVDGYDRVPRPAHESGSDLNGWTWQRKRRAWRRPMQLVATSRWMAECAGRSALMHDWPLRVIPYPLDLQAFQPQEQALARATLGFAPHVRIVLFGAVGGTTDHRKGADLLFAALQRLSARTADQRGFEVHVVIFGEDPPARPVPTGFPTHYAGTLTDDAVLRLHYAAADVMVVPSRLEAFGQTASEAAACGVPVVAFRVGGLADIVDHQRTGYLAEPSDPVSLAEGIEWVLADTERRLQLGRAAREAATRRWEPGRIAQEYVEVYRAVLARASDGE